MAYYAVYHTCARLLQKEVEEGKLQGRISHRGLIKELSDCKKATNPILRNASERYDGLFALRVKADYNLNICINAGHADDALEKAEAILGISLEQTSSALEKLHRVK
ncbi:hypothetical protein Amal_03650 [Acetobacter malorum]|uniref:HEPN domain-containing protein n=1 Tax=Acetobacter malorum TaxID=178901 RepID=A0A177G4C3_9PROT|nr:hypothetical protein Amal_03650 [Acetobacter malorum]